MARRPVGRFSLASYGRWHYASSGRHIDLYLDSREEEREAFFLQPCPLFCYLRAGAVVLLPRLSRLLRYLGVGTAVLFNEFRSFTWTAPPFLAYKPREELASFLPAALSAR